VILGGAFFLHRRSVPEFSALHLRGLLGRIGTGSDNAKKTTGSGGLLWS